MNRWSLLALGLTATASIAQTLPAPSRTVYKCEQAGKVHYSDAPCLGAKKLDVEPTRGLDKSSGQERRGPDVQRELRREAFADGLRPLTGMDARQLDQLGRRQRLSPEAQRLCATLDVQLPAAEAAESQVTDMATRKVAQQRLFELRRTYHQLRCP